MVRKLKRTEIGDIPIDWELQTFEETFNVLSSNTLSRENLNNRSGVVRNIHYGDILTKFSEVLDCKEEDIPYIDDLSLLTSSAQLLRDGDIVIADTAEDETVGKVTEVQNLGNGKLVAGLHTIPCRVKKGDFVPGWLGYYMNSHMYHNQIIPYITGIKVSSISKSAIANTWIVIPPIEEQKRIVEILSQIDLLIRKEQEVTDKITAVKMGCLSKMFPKAGESIPEMRLPGFDGDWEKQKLIEVCDYVDYRGKTPSKTDEGIFLVTAKNVKAGYIDYDVSKQYISENVYEEVMHRGMPQIGDVLITTEAPCGNVAQVNREDIALAQRIIKYRGHNDVVNNTYLKHYLLSSTFQRILLAKSSGGTVQGIKGSILHQQEIMLPKYKEQIDIGRNLDNLDHLITLHQQKYHKYMKIKSGLISMLIR